MDLENANRQPTHHEFIAVILSGFGKELFPITADHGDEPVPKALLPVANKPLLHYTLSWLEKSGVRHVLLVCPLSHRSAISHHVHSDPSYSSLTINIQPYDQSPDLSIGTCALLRHFSSHIQEDFILLPVDFIPPDSLPLSTLLNKFRLETVSNGAIATACWFEPRPLDKGAPIEEWGPIPATVPILWDEKTTTLLYVDTEDEAIRDSDNINLRMKLLTDYPRTRIRASLQDSHVYICKRSVLDVLHLKTHFDSFKEEFFPWLCKIQHQQLRREKYGHVLNPFKGTTIQALALQHSTTHINGHDAHRHAIPSLKLIKPSSVQTSRTDTPRSIPTSPISSDDQEGEYASLRVGLVLHRAADGFCARVNNVHSYMQANKHFLSQTTYVPPREPAARSLIDGKAQISADSMVGDSTRIGEKTSIKRCVVGMHCVIGKMVKMVGCVVLDHCFIADSVKLENCILGKNTKVGTKAELVRCITQAGFEVDAGGTFKNEKLEASDWAAGNDEGIGEDDQADGEQQGED